MPIRNVVIAEKTIRVGKEGEIVVRGISLSDLMAIVNIYGPQTSLLFSKVKTAKSLEPSEVRMLIGTLAGEFPEMCAAAIALAADSYDEETMTLVQRLPFHKQVEVIEAIFSLTFSQEGELKKFLESLTEMLAEALGTLKTLQLPSLSGTGASVAP